MAISLLKHCVAAPKMLFVWAYYATYMYILSAHIVYKFQENIEQLNLFFSQFFLPIWIAINKIKADRLMRNVFFDIFCYFANANALESAYALN